MLRSQAEDRAPALSVVIPIFRNEKTIEDLVARLARSLATTPGGFEMIFVDDASPDASAAILERAAARDPRISVLHLFRNVGQHRAVMVGLAHARGSWVVVMDGDLQDPPEAIPALLAVDPPADAVFAGRRGSYESRSRLLTSRMFKRTLAILTRLPPDAGMFVALDRPMVERLLAMGGSAPFVPAMIGCSGLSLASVPVERAPRASGVSSYTNGARVRAALRALRWIAAYRTGRLERSEPADAVGIRRIGARFSASDERR